MMPKVDWWVVEEIVRIRIFVLSKGKALLKYAVCSIQGRAFHSPTLPLNIKGMVPSITKKNGGET